VKEQDIRPDALAKRYYELSALDADRCFPDQAGRTAVACVGCGSSDASFALEKNGFAYAQCRTCGTLYQSPRPPLDAFEAFYRNSESSSYWSDVFFPAVAEVRREKIFRPRVEGVAAMAAARGHAVESIVDVGAGFGIFLDEWRALAPGITGLAIEPGHNLAEACRAKGFEVIEDIAENVVGRDGAADLVVCFEVLEHVWEPLQFVEQMVRLAKPGGLVFLTTLGVDGFDIQTLWERSNAIFPPHHINFLSVAGFERLFERAGLTDIEVRTPGKLDVDIVRNAWAAEPALAEGHRFLAHLLEDERRAAAFQAFLADNRLSSHTWVMGRKPMTGENALG
jgi:SAM-dependent methyltransferase